MLWSKRYRELCNYKNTYGHCNVPYKDKDKPQLATWVCRQREMFYKGKLTDIRFYLLDELGFEWDPFNNTWAERISELMLFKKVHGDCNIHSRFSWKPALARWVAQQRYYYKRNLLSEDRVNMLNVLGFVWTPKEEVWEQRLYELKKYRELHGHCNVLSRHQENKKLAKWVETQRYFYKKKLLSNDRIKRLKNIGFIWVIEQMVCN